MIFSIRSNYNKHRGWTLYYFDASTHYFAKTFCHESWPSPKINVRVIRRNAFSPARTTLILEL